MKSHGSRRAGWMGFLPALFAVMMPVALPGTHAGEIRPERSVPPGEFTFAVLGDSRTPVSSEDLTKQPEAFFENIREINLLDYDLVIDVGDLIRGYVDDPDLIRRMWDGFDRAVERFQMPVRLVPGNHDIWNETSASIWQERYGAFYYSFDHKGSHFVVLSSEIPGATDRIEGDQLRWLADDLNSAKNAAHIFVFLHKPLWRYEQSNWMKDVHPLLASAGVDAVFAGHEHIYEKNPTLDGVRYYVTGGGGSELGGWTYLGEFYHHLHVSVRPERVEIAVIRPGEGIFPDGIVTREMRRRFLVDLVGGLQSFAYVYEPPGKPGPASVTIENPLDEPLRCDIDWEAGSGWTIEPAHLSRELPPGKPVELSFRVTPSRERFFPPPGYSVKLWLGDTMIRQITWKLDAGCDDWWVRDWWVAGPFPLGTKHVDKQTPPPGFDREFGPEQAVDLAREYPGKAGPVRWRRIRVPDVRKPAIDRAVGYRGSEGAAISFLSLWPETENAIAYAWTTLEAPRPMTTWLSVSSDDGLKVWVNGEEILRRHVLRGIGPDQEVVPLKLREGANTLLVKVEQGKGDWALAARIVDLDGELKVRVPEPGDEAVPLR